MNAYDKALYLLSGREHTAKEIRMKLSAKGYGEEEIESAIIRLVAEKAIDDARYVESYVRSRARKGGESVTLMRMKLLERGVSRDKVDAVLNVYRESDEYFDCLKKSYQALSSRKGEEKALRSLLTKGYTLSEIKRAKEDLN